MVGKRMPTREGIWNEIIENLVAELTLTFCRDENDPQEVKAARSRAIRVAEIFHGIASLRVGGTETYYPKFPRCLRDERNKVMSEKFDGRNYAAIGADAPLRAIRSRQVRYILKLNKLKR